MTIEEIMNLIELELINKKKDPKYNPGVSFALGMINKYYKNNQENKVEEYKPELKSTIDMFKY